MSKVWRFVSWDSRYSTSISQCVYKQYMGISYWSTQGCTDKWGTDFPMEKLECSVKTLPGFDQSKARKRSLSGNMGPCCCDHETWSLSVGRWSQVRGPGWVTRVSFRWVRDNWQQNIIMSSAWDRYRGCHMPVKSIKHEGPLVCSIFLS